MRHSLHSGAQPALGIGSLDLDPNHDFDSIWTMDYNASTYQSPAEWDQMILYRPPAGTSCPFEKAMSPEILLNIVEFLEAPQCLTLSQTCKRIYILSRERRGYWTKCAFTHGLLLPGPREQYTTADYCQHSNCTLGNCTQNAKYQGFITRLSDISRLFMATEIPEHYKSQYI